MATHTVVDVTTDVSSNFLYQKLGQVIEPTFVESVVQEAKTASMHGFAWPEKRLFPITSAKAAAVSEVYAQAQRDTVPAPVQERLNQALLLYNG